MSQFNVLPLYYTNTMTLTVDGTQHAVPSSRLPPLLPTSQLQAALADTDASIALTLLTDTASTPISNNEDRQRWQRQFPSFFQDDLPLGLPPQRTVQHSIDLLPESTPPSKGIYPCSQTKLAGSFRSIFCAL